MTLSSALQLAAGGLKSSQLALHRDQLIFTEGLDRSLELFKCLCRFLQALLTSSQSLSLLLLQGRELLLLLL